MEDILSSNECIEDLKANQNSKYKKILTTKNIKKLISFCIYPSESSTIISYDTLRYPYYSSELLCSPSILQFSKSAESILKANERQNRINEEKVNKEEENYINYDLLLNENANNENNIQEDIFSQEEQKQEERIENYYEDFFSESKGLEHEEFMNFDKHQETESEFQNTTMVNNNKTHFEEKEKVMEKIFGFLEQKINLDETCVGYFQKMVNYLLINEPKVTTDYLFNDNYLIIRNFYNHMNNASMENIFENILNYISDQESKEVNLENSKFNLIILELLDEIACNINKEYNDNNDNINYINDKKKIEFISELIINTLINNTEQHLIKLVFSSNIFMKKIIFLIEK